MKRVRPKDRDIAMVFQNYALYPHLTVDENMAFGLKLRGSHQGGDQRAGRGGRAMLGLDDVLDRKPRRCPAASASASRWAGRSCGSRRCSLDEPLSNLDAKLRV